MTLTIQRVCSRVLLPATIATTLFAQGQTLPRLSDIQNIGTRDINRGNINFVPIEKEIATGRQLGAELEGQLKLVDDPAINEYVNRLGQNIVRNSDARVPFTIKVVNSPEVNSVSLPGGFVYL